MRLISHREVNLLSNGIIVPLEGFLGFSILCGIGKFIIFRLFINLIMRFNFFFYVFLLIFIARIVCSVTFIVDVLPTHYVYREMISDAQWITSQLSVITYLAGVFRTLPRMAFFQPSYSDNNLSPLTTNTTISVPTIHLIKILYWIISIALIIIASGSAILSGYFRMKGNKFLLDVFTTTRLVAYGF